MNVRGQPRPDFGPQNALPYDVDRIEVDDDGRHRVRCSRVELERPILPEENIAQILDRFLRQRSDRLLLCDQPSLYKE